MSICDPPGHHHHSAKWLQVTHLLWPPLVAIYSVFMKISIHYYAPLVLCARVHNIRRVTEKIFVVSGYHCSLWPKVTRVERFLRFSGSNPDCKGIGHQRDAPVTGAWSSKVHFT